MVVDCPFQAGDRRHVGLAQPRRRLNQRLEYLLQIERRAADNLEHVGSGGLLLEGFAQFVEQTRILDGDDGLAREALDQLDLLVGEGSNLLTIDGNCANQLVLLEHRHDDKGAGAAEIGHSPDRRKAVKVSWVSLEVVGMNWLFGASDAPQRRLGCRLKLSAMA